MHRTQEAPTAFSRARYRGVVRGCFSSDFQFWNPRKRKNYIVQIGDNLLQILDALGVCRQKFGRWEQEVFEACCPEDLQVGVFLEIGVMPGTQDSVLLQMRGKTSVACQESTESGHP